MASRSMHEDNVRGRSRPIRQWDRSSLFDMRSHLYGEPAFFRQKNVEECEWKDVPKDVIMNGDRIGKRTSSDRTKSDD